MFNQRIFKAEVNFTNTNLFYQTCGAIGKGNAPEVNNMPVFTALHRRGRTQSLDVDLIPIVLATNEFSRVMNRCV